MVKKVNADQNLRELAAKVQRSGDQFVIEEAGEEIAALVPISILRAYQESQDARERFFATIDDIQNRNRGTKSEEVERDVAEAVRAVRKKTSR